MITKLSGRLAHVAEDWVGIEAGAFEYEVRVSDHTRRQLQPKLDKQVTLHTLEYLEGNPAHGKLIPRIIGFVSEIEREFFEMFCSVDGVGVKKALRAMVHPVPDIASAIEEQNTSFLSSLPGVGAAGSERIVAKLRRKMSKFALLIAERLPREAEVSRDVVRDAFEVLRTLGHSEADARKLLDAALAAKKKYKEVEELIQAVYEKNRAP